MFPSMKMLSYIGCLATLALATPVPESLQPKDQLLKARQAPYQASLVDTGTTFGLENNGVWQLIDATADGLVDLAYIKTTSTGTGRVEVHIASSSSAFETRILETGTTFFPETDGTWLLIPSRDGALPDLVFVKTANTPSGRVEVHIASGASGYAARTVETPTAFGNEQGSGVWSLYDYDGDGVPDLVYIKTRNTGSGRVEVHVASGASSYGAFVAHAVTAFAEVVVNDGGFWSLAPYSSPGAADLVYIRTVGTLSGRVEVRVASGASGYQDRIFTGASRYVAQTNSVWSLVDYNGNGILDLAQIRYGDTGGSVTVRVASG